jgi:hypothetical protein
MNPSADTQIIYPGTIVAQVSPVQEVVNPNSKIDEEGELRTNLINLLERDQGLEDGEITSLFNSPFTCLTISFAKTSGSLRGRCFIECADPVAILCSTTFVRP